MKRYHPLGRLYHATRYSLNGLRCAFRQEQAFEYETVVLAVLAAVALGGGLPFSEGVALLAAWLGVMAIELVNAAVERAFDLLDREYNLQIKEGKDMLSAAVFLAIAANIALWALLLLRRFSFY